MKLFAPALGLAGVVLMFTCFVAKEQILTHEKLQKDLKFNPPNKVAVITAASKLCPPPVECSGCHYGIPCGENFKIKFMTIEEYHKMKLGI